MLGGGQWFAVSVVRADGHTSFQPYSVLRILLKMNFLNLSIAIRVKLLTQPSNIQRLDKKSLLALEDSHPKL